MSILTKRFTVNVPTSGHQGEEVLIGLSRLIGVTPLHKSWDGRRYVALPAPYADVRIYDGDTLTPAQCTRLAAAIQYLLAQDGETRSVAETHALEVLKAART